MTLKDRKTYMGGSDMNRLVNGGRDEWPKLWEEKTGRSNQDDLSNNLAVQMGSHTESFNIQWFVENTGLPLQSEDQPL